MSRGALVFNSHPRKYYTTGFVPLNDQSPSSDATSGFDLVPPSSGAAAFLVSSGREVVAECLDGDVDMTDDLATLDCLRSRVICGIEIGERAGLQIDNLFVDVQVRVGSNVVVGRRIRDDGGYHVGGRRNVSHD